MALAQSSSVARNIPANVEGHLRHVEAARAAGAAVVVFPELSLTGYELEAIREQAELRVTPLDERLDPLRAASRRSGLVILCGAPVQERDSTLLAALAFRPDGSTSVYGKRSLYGDERGVFEAGAVPLLLEVHRFRLAVGVCADLSDQSQIGEVKALAADAWVLGALVTPIGWSADCKRARDAARASGASVLLVNHAAPTGGWPSAAMSGAWGPDGRQLPLRSRGDRSTVLVAKVVARGTLRG